MALLPTPGSTLPNFRAPFLEAIDIGGAEPTLETVIPIFCDGSVLLFCFVALTFSIYCGDGTLANPWVHAAEFSGTVSYRQADGGGQVDRKP